MTQKSKYLAAFTGCDVHPPAFINAYREGDEVVVSVRSGPTVEYFNDYRIGASGETVKAFREGSQSSIRMTKEQFAAFIGEVRINMGWS